MSKGLGKQQQRILDELDKRPVFYLDELAQTRSEQVSLNRAAWKLSDAGLIQLKRFYCGRQKNMIARPGAYIDRTAYDRAQWRQRYDQAHTIISVEQVTDRHPFNTKTGGEK